MQHLTQASIQLGEELGGPQWQKRCAQVDEHTSEALKGNFATTVASATRLSGARTTLTRSSAADASCAMSAAALSPATKMRRLVFDIGQRAAASRSDQEVGTVAQHNGCGDCILRC